MTPSLAAFNYLGNIILFLVLVIPVSFASLVLFVVPFTMILHPLVKSSEQSLTGILALMSLSSAIAGPALSIAHTYALTKSELRVRPKIIRRSILYAVVMSAMTGLALNLFFFRAPAETFNLVLCSILYGWIVGHIVATGKTFREFCSDLRPYAQNAATFLIIVVSSGVIWDLARVPAFRTQTPHFQFLMILYAFSLPHLTLVSLVHTWLRSRWSRGTRSEMVWRSMWFAAGLAVLDVIFAFAFLLPVGLIGSWAVTEIPSALFYGWFVARKASRESLGAN